MDLIQMDVKTTFLHGDLHEDIYRSMAPRGSLDLHRDETGGTEQTL